MSRRSSANWEPEKPHVRVERGWENRAAQRHRRPNYQWSYPDVLAAITATR